MKKIYYFLSITLVVVSLLLRIYKIENRAPFDWDQNRDFKAISEIASGKPILIGPVAKGEGGFLLGPLYYYIVTPAYLLSGQSPIALPLTAAILDVVTIAMMLYLLPSIIGKKMAFSVSFIWSFSWFAIEMSRISWNVALIPLWSVLIIWIITLRSIYSPSMILFFGLLVGTSWHIHAALIPTSVLLALIYFRIWTQNWKSIAFFVLGYLIPLIPLIIFDIRHSGINIHLMSEMLKSGSQVDFQLPIMLQSALMRLGKNIQSIFTGISEYSLILGSVLMVLSLASIAYYKGLYRVCGIIIVLNFIAIMYLREPGFPEYYFAFSYIPSILIIIKIVHSLTKDSVAILLIIGVLVGITNFMHYSLSETSFGLSRKMSVAKLMSEQGQTIDLYFDLVQGREGGIVPLYKKYGGTIDKSSALKIVVSDKNDGPINLDGELTSVIGNFGGLRVSKLIVE